MRIFIDPSRPLGTLPKNARGLPYNYANFHCGFGEDGAGCNFSSFPAYREYKERE